jgi:hypothetical protein
MTEKKVSNEASLLVDGSEHPITNVTFEKDVENDEPIDMGISVNQLEYSFDVDVEKSFDTQQERNDWVERMALLFGCGVLTDSDGRKHFANIEFSEVNNNE